MADQSFKNLIVQQQTQQSQNKSFLKLKHSFSISTTDDCSSENMSFVSQGSQNCFSALSVSDIQNQPETKKNQNKPQIQHDFNKIQNYQLVELIGRGTFGSVYKAIFLPLSKQIALKVINFNQFDEETKAEVIKLYENEVQVLKMLEQKSSFKFTCQFYGSFVHESYGYIILELLEGFSLQELIQSQIQLAAHQQQFYLASIVLALQQLHDKVGCLHRDIKPENIMVSSKGQLLLLDFGCAKALAKGERTSSITGTCEYFSPSRFKCNYSNQADIWSFGVTAYELITKKLPFQFQGMQNSQQQQKFFKLSSILKKQKNIKLIELQDYDPIFKQLIQGVFNSVINVKPQLYDFTAIKNNLFFKQFDWNMLSKNKVVPPRVYSLNEIREIRQNYQFNFNEF